MKIILVRHAKVLLTKAKAIHASEMAAFIRAYDTADIDKTEPESAALEVMVREGAVLACSALKRSVESLGVLGRTPDEVDAVFNEAEVPELHIRWLKLSPKVWLILGRFLSFSGVGLYGKSMQKSRTRAEKAAEKLMALAEEHDSVLLVGHGGMNWLISKVLQRKGWKEEKKPGVKNWDHGIFTRQ